jgi:hypothetical protein
VDAMDWLLSLLSDSFEVGYLEDKEKYCKFNALAITEV